MTVSRTLSDPCYTPRCVCSLPPFSRGAEVSATRTEIAGRLSRESVSLLPYTKCCTPTDLYTYIHACTYTHTCAHTHTSIAITSANHVLFMLEEYFLKSIVAQMMFVACLDRKFKLKINFQERCNIFNPY